MALSLSRGRDPRELCSCKWLSHIEPNSMTPTPTQTNKLRRPGIANGTTKNAVRIANMIASTLPPQYCPYRPFTDSSSFGAS